MGSCVCVCVCFEVQVGVQYFCRKLFVGIVLTMCSDSKLLHVMASLDWVGSCDVMWCHVILVCVGVQLSSPVVSVWLHIGGKLDLLDVPTAVIPDCGDPTHSRPALSSQSVLPSGLMMLHFNDQLYLQPLSTAATGGDNKQVCHHYTVISAIFHSGACSVSHSTY